MAKTKYIVIAGPKKPGTKVPRPGRPGVYRDKDARFYNSDGYKPGEPFKRVVPLDPHHMGLIVDGTCHQEGKYMNAAEAEKMRAKLAPAPAAADDKPKGKGKK